MDASSTFSQLTLAPIKCCNQQKCLYTINIKILFILLLDSESLFGHFVHVFIYFIPTETKKNHSLNLSYLAQLFIGSFYLFILSFAFDIVCNIHCVCVLNVTDFPYNFSYT